MHFFEAEMRTPASAAPSSVHSCGLRFEREEKKRIRHFISPCRCFFFFVSRSFRCLFTAAAVRTNPPLFLPPSFRPPLTHELLEASLPLLLCRLGQHYIIPPLFPPFLNPLPLPLREARDAAARGLSLWLEVLNSACVPKGDDVY